MERMTPIVRGGLREQAAVTLAQAVLQRFGQSASSHNQTTKRSMSTMLGSSAVVTHPTLPETTDRPLKIRLFTDKRCHDILKNDEAER